MKQHREGIDPLVAKPRAKHDSIRSVDDLFADWHEGTTFSAPLQMLRWHHPLMQHSKYH